MEFNSKQRRKSIKVWLSDEERILVESKAEFYGYKRLAKYIRDADLKGVAPGSENLKNLFNECGPCLILMDELVAYAKVLFGAEGLPAGSFDNFITFI